MLAELVPFCPNLAKKGKGMCIEPLPKSHYGRMIKSMGSLGIKGMGERSLKKYS